MTETAAAQLRRILQVIPHLADGEEHELAEIAGTIDTAEETILGDLRSLALRFDDPGGFVEGVQIFLESERVSMVSTHFLRPMRLTSAELRALDLGLAMLRGEQPPEAQGVTERARERLRKVITRLPATDGMPLAASSGSAGGVRELAIVRDALMARRAISISYRRGSATEATERVIHPYAVISARGAWYVAALCAHASELRIFRLDRMERATLLDERFTIPDDFVLDDVLASGRAFLGAVPDQLRVRYTPRVARWIAEREGATPDADGSLTMEYPLADLDWAVRHVLQYGPDAVVLGPEQVRIAVRERLQAMQSSA